MKTKAVLSTVFFYLLIFNITSNLSYSQETATKADQPLIEIKNIPLQQTIVMKAEVLTNVIGRKMGEMYSSLFSYAGQNNIQPTGAPFAVYYTFDPKGNTSFEVGFPVASKVSGCDSVFYKEFPPMKVVSSLYTGSYENMSLIYTQMQDYIHKNNLKIIGASWEVYLTNPQQVSNPNDNQTLIYFPIE
jgi:effector-binding domain-containing protein